MDAFLHILVKFFPFLPAKKEDKKLVFSIIYHIAVFLGGGMLMYACIFIGFLLSNIMIYTMILLPLGIIGIIILFPLAIVSMVLLVGYSAIGTILTICSYCGVDFLSKSDGSAEPVIISDSIEVNE